jgi:hypothetical protein
MKSRYRSIHTGLEFVRDNERLVCGSFDWWESCELAISFGWKPSFASAKSLSYMLTEYPLDVPAEDALSFSQAIARCLTMLLNNQKLGILLSRMEPGVFDVCHHEVVRLAFFCARGPFRIEHTTILPS